MRCVIFCHSLVSDWNHGNAHFLRGIASELVARGHAVTVCEPLDAWSVTHLVAEEGDWPIRQFGRVYPELHAVRYDPQRLDLNKVLAHADLVLVHEWNAPALVKAIGQQRARGQPFTLLFHDTHHRSVTDPGAMASYDLSHYDGVLAFGEVIRQIYLKNGWTRRAWTWHEAADARRFLPMPNGTSHGDLVWVGNWGDEERTRELREFLIQPVRALRLKARIHGVRYPESARQLLLDNGIDYAGWLPNFDVPRVFAHYEFTVHVPRRPYVEALPGIPTIRVFEALACGMPLVCSPWRDTEELFQAGRDYLVVRDGAGMETALRTLSHEPGQARALAEHGRRTVLERHTCGHRVNELLQIHAEVRA